MASTLTLLLVFVFIHVGFSSDSDPVRDFCIPTNDNSLQCKNSSLATVEDFIFSGIKSAGKFKNGFYGLSVTSTIFPGLNTLGMSFVRADFEKGGVNVPHYHPRATETVFVIKGKLYSGFVNSENKVFAKVIEKGDVMVIPRGLLHFQINVGDSKATILGSFNSQNPGIMRIPSAVFGSGINEELLVKAFGLNHNDILKMKKRFAPSLTTTT